MQAGSIVHSPPHAAGHWLTLLALISPVYYPDLYVISASSSPPAL